MTAPSRPVRRMDRGRRFNLRATALFFALLAIILCVLVFVVRTAASIVESRPVWAGSLIVMGIAAAPLCRSRWRRFSAARYARRAAEALEDAAERASAERELGGEEGEEATTVLDPPDDYAELDPDGFEHAIADLCARDDCREVEVVGGARDLGADVMAVTSDGLRVVIQCKRYGDDNKVGSQELQRFGGTCFTVHDADIAALVTTSDFTAPALEYAQQCGIVCVNGADLHAWLDGTGPRPWEAAGVEP
ncbi:restriction endonuclease [Streptomyces sp. BA2]|uniref:restriction endonuclease n=1 Tax=Streptomyces sp. BA2 TaxID=436595 RepID=UPI001321A861|nr:restriction endonuclease [Streptomyces sp. BA2]MWA15770.1 restriction endonuclease [Streptomyces sp. BA2]